MILLCLRIHWNLKIQMICTWTIRVNWKILLKFCPNSRREFAQNIIHLPRKQQKIQFLTNLWYLLLVNMMHAKKVSFYVLDEVKRHPIPKVLVTENKSDNPRMIIFIHVISGRMFLSGTFWHLLYFDLSSESSCCVTPKTKINKGWFEYLYL